MWIDSLEIRIIAAINAALCGFALLVLPGWGDDLFAVIFGLAQWKAWAMIDRLD